MAKAINVQRRRVEESRARINDVASRPGRTALCTNAQTRTSDGVARKATGHIMKMSQKHTVSHLRSGTSITSHATTRVVPVARATTSDVKASLTSCRLSENIRVILHPVFLRDLPCPFTDGLQEYHWKRSNGGKVQNAPRDGSMRFGRVIPPFRTLVRT